VALVGSTRSDLVRDDRRVRSGKDRASRHQREPTALHDDDDDDVVFVT
jgi:hypothetical protein